MVPSVCPEADYPTKKIYLNEDALRLFLFWVCWRPELAPAGKFLVVYFRSTKIFLNHASARERTRTFMPLRGGGF